MKRLNDLRESMTEHGLDAMFLHQRENVLYITGFSGTTGGLYVTENKAFVLVDSRYVTQAKEQCAGFEVVNTARPWEIAKVMNGEKLIGFEEDVLTYDVYHQLKAEAGEGAELIPSAEIMKKQRMIKDEAELENLKTAVRIADNAFHHIQPFIREGVEEVE